MSIAVEIRVDPEQFSAAELLLDDLDQRLTDEAMLGHFGAVSEALAGFYESNFPPPDSDNLTLQADTLRRHPEEQPLNLDDTLHKSLSAKRAGSDAIRTITPSSLRFGTRLSYARLVNDGTRNMSGRHFFELNESVTLVIEDVLAERVGVADLLHVI